MPDALPQRSACLKCGSGTGYMTKNCPTCHITAERARMDREGTTRACPICGAEVWNTCYHDGIDYQCREMPKAEARRKRT